MPKGKFLRGLAVAAVVIATTCFVVMGFVILIFIAWGLLGGGVQLG